MFQNTPSNTPDRWPYDFGESSKFSKFNWGIPKLVGECYKNFVGEEERKQNSTYFHKAKQISERMVHMIYTSNFPVTNYIIFEKFYLFICSPLLVACQNKESLTLKNLMRGQNDPSCFFGITQERKKIFQPNFSHS